jgi:hypothetical protein
MATDTIIDGIHKFREEYALSFNNDLKAICEDARNKQGHDGRKVIQAQPKPSQKLNVISQKSA